MSEGRFATRHTPYAAAPVERDSCPQPRSARKRNGRRRATVFRFGVGWSLRDQAGGFAAAPVERGSHPQPRSARKQNGRRRATVFRFGGGMVASRPGRRLCRCACRTGFSSATTLGQKAKWPREGAILFSGGEGGIRTHEGLLTLAGFQDQCIQPLCHLSKLCSAPPSGGMDRGLRRMTSAWTRRIPAARLAGALALLVRPKRLSCRFV